MITIILLLLFLSWINRQKAKKIEGNVNAVNDIGLRMEMLDKKHSANIMSVIFALVAMGLMILMILKV